MATLVISTFPPEQCGVATFTQQAVDRLREEGESVQLLSWGVGSSDFKLSAKPSGMRALQLLPYCRRADRVILHYIPEFFVDSGSRLGQIASRIALTRLFRSVRTLEVMVHEQPWYPPVQELSAPGRLLWQLERLQWRAAPQLLFHNAHAIRVFQERFALPGDNARVLPHGCHFRPNYQGTWQEARHGLQLPANSRMFASVGFISPRKGYEVALEALALVPDLDCEYHIVGSPHPSTLEVDASYIERLREQSAADPRIKFHVGYVDDRAFDQWTCAADAILIPSHAASTSSVLARCHLFDTPAVASYHPGLVEEMVSRDRTVQSTGELAQALQQTPRKGTEG